MTTYGYVYELATGLFASITGGNDIPFSNNGPLSGITHSTGATAVVVPITGNYQIDYSVNITAGLGSGIAIAVNNNVQPSTHVTALVSTGGISGSAILPLSASNSVTLRNDSGTTLTMDLDPGIGAQLVLMLLADAP